MTEISRQILKFLLIVKYLTISVSSDSAKTDYCFVECLLARNTTHTVCKRLHQCGPVDGCAAVDSDENFRTLILHQHNEIRNRIANGSDKGTYGNTGAKNMHVLSYDMELEYIAACAVNMCAGAQDDWCNDSERFPVEKNQIYGKSINWTARAVSEFYKRIEYVKDVSEINEYTPVRSDLRWMESFIRLVWAETRYVGCSRSRKRQINGETMLACLYAPAFYIRKNPVYKMAAIPSEIASECEDGRNKDYNALCGRISPLPVEIPWVRQPRSSVDSLHTKLHLDVYSGLFFMNIMVNRFRIV